MRTPSGAIAIVIETFEGIGEALVEWADGERARFRVKHLVKQ